MSFDLALIAICRWKHNILGYISRVTVLTVN